MRRIFEFVCPAQHWHEVLVDDQLRQHECDQCALIGERIISAPRCKLEGHSGAFPSAARTWENTRNSHMRKERLVKDRHNEVLPDQKPPKKTKFG